MGIAPLALLVGANFLRGVLTMMMNMMSKKSDGRTDGRAIGDGATRLCSGCNLKAVDALLSNQKQGAGIKPCPSDTPTPNTERKAA